MAMTKGIRRVNIREYFWDSALTVEQAETLAHRMLSGITTPTVLTELHNLIEAQRRARIERDEVTVTQGK